MMNYPTLTAWVAEKSQKLIIEKPPTPTFIKSTDAMQNVSRFP